MLDQISSHRPAPPAVSASSGTPPPQELPPPERLARFRLARTRGVGPKRFHQLLGQHGSARRALEILEKESPANVAGEAAVLDEIARGHEAGAEWSVFGDGAHPAFGTDSGAVPPLLWRRGNPAFLAGPAAVPAVAIVGAREASAPGRALAREFAATLAEAGFLVVSGLARGIDTEAHRAALSVGGGGSVAVLPCGIDRVYPARNVDLARRMADPAGPGAVISALPVGTRVHPRNFPGRNRLIAALAGAVIIIEAAERSGTILTARLAAELGRDVLVVPGHPHDPRARGANRLIREGAILIRDMHDVFEALTSPFANPMAAPHPAERTGDADKAPPPVAGAPSCSSRRNPPARQKGQGKGDEIPPSCRESDGSTAVVPARRQDGCGAQKAAFGRRGEESDSAEDVTPPPGEDSRSGDDTSPASETGGMTSSSEDMPHRNSPAGAKANPPGQPPRNAQDETHPALHHGRSCSSAGSSLSPLEQEILALFTAEPVLEDRILRAAPVPVRKAIAHITHLELKGYLARLPDGRIQKLKGAGTG